MKILHIISCLSRAAGTSVFCAEVCNGLARDGHDVTVAINDSIHEVEHYPLDSQVNLMSIISLFKTIDYKSFDIVHIHALWTPILHKASKWARGKNLPIVWSPHGMLTPWAMNNKHLKKLLGWWLYQKRDLINAALIHATAECEVGDVRRMGLNNKVVVAPLGVKVDIDDRLSDHDNPEKILLFVSRVQRKKGLLNLARAWSHLADATKRGWKVRVVGPDQENHLEEVRSECVSLGILDDWQFVGPKFGDALSEEYRSASLFVLPTYSENFGSVVIEALSYGVPVICTKGAPWAELDECGCGWWVDIGIEPLAVALKEAMSLDDARRREMGVRGRALVEEKYIWDAVVKAMVKGYEAILKEE